MRGDDEGATVSLLHLDRVVAEAARAGATASSRFARSPKAATASMADGASTRVRRARRSALASALRVRLALRGGPRDRRRGRERAALAPERGAVLRLDVPPRDSCAARRTSSRTRSARRSRSTPCAGSPLRSREAGSLPIAYAAVYAVGKEAWPEWEGEGLFRARRLALDARRLPLERRSDEPSAGSRTSSTTCGAALDAVGFNGFHLDQYGSPKWALRTDGSVRRARRGVPGADRAARAQTCRKRG